MAIRQTQENINNDPSKVGTTYTVSNPHPGWNAEDPENPFDPNIKNEFGHTHYPKWIDHPWKKEVQVSVTSINIGGGQTKQERNEHKEDKRGRSFPLKVLVNSKEEEERVMNEKEGQEPEKAKGWTKPA